VNVVATWQDSNGKVYYSAPKLGTDYSFTYNTGNWTLKDGYYYYNTAVAGGTDDISFANEVKQLSNAPTEDYTLHLEVLVETIQAIGKTDGNNSAVMDAWNIQPDVKEADDNGNKS
jgi:hypothetical protein